MSDAPLPFSERTRLRRYHWLGKYDRDTINAIIDAGIICQVGYVFNGEPYVTPTSHWRIDDYVYWHGSSASRMLKAQQTGIPVCFTVTHLDGIVFARAAMNHNVQFRSVMAFGEAELVPEDQKRAALAVFTDRLAPGLWDYARKPSEQEWLATKVIRLRLDDVSAKINDVFAGDEEDDLASDLWSGAVPLSVAQGEIIPDPRLAPGIAMPDFARIFRYLKNNVAESRHDPCVSRFPHRRIGVSLVLVELQLSRSGAATLQTQIADQLRRQIVDKHLAPGCELPPSRELARQYDVSRNTVIHAYERLLSEGYLSTVKGVGTFVAPVIPEMCLLAGKADDAAPKQAPTTPRAPIVFGGETLAVPAPPTGRGSIVDFWPGRPDRARFPSAIWRKLADDALSSMTVELTEYGDPAGLPALRAAIARHVGLSRGVACSADAVIVTAGTQEAINLVARILVADGTGVVIEDPGYGSAARTFESYGARLHPVPVDHDGLMTEMLPGKGVSFAYVTPSHQFPTGATLSAQRRRDLLDWAYRTGAYVVEDDYDSDYNFDGPPALSLAGADNGQCVIYVGTFSKSLGAGIRTGYLIVPPQLVSVARRVKTMNNYGHPWLEQAILESFISKGAYQRHLRTIRKACSAKLKCLISCLQAAFGQIEIWGANGGMHVMWLLPDWMPPAEDFRASLAAHGIYVHTFASSGACSVAGRYRDRAILLGYAALSEREIVRAVDIMGRLIPSTSGALRQA